MSASLRNFDLSSRELLRTEQLIGQLEFCNREIERATGLKNESLTSMSQELRQELNAILGFSESLAGEEPLNADQKQVIDSIRNDALHLLQTIDEILQKSENSG